MLGLNLFLLYAKITYWNPGEELTLGFHCYKQLFHKSAETCSERGIFLQTYTWKNVLLFQASK